MSIFSKAYTHHQQTPEEEELFRIKVMTKMKLMQILSKNFVFGRSKSETEASIVTAQILNYLMGDKIGGNDKTPPNTLKYIKSIKDEVPLLAYSYMQEQSIYVPVMYVLLLQEATYTHIYGNRYYSSRQGEATKYLLDTFNPKRKPVNSQAYLTFLQTFQESN